MLRICQNIFVHTFTLRKLPKAAPACFVRQYHAHDHQNTILTDHCSQNLLPSFPLVVSSLHLRKRRQLHYLNHLRIKWGVADQEQLRLDDLFFKILELFYGHRFFLRLM